MMKPPTVSYGPSSGTRTPARSSSSSGRSMPGKVSQFVERTTPGASAVVLVGDLADELLDQVLQRRPRRRCRRTRRRRPPSGSRGHAARRAGGPGSSSPARAAARTAARTPARPPVARAARATACFTWTSPTMSSMPSSTTGNREYPVRRARSITVCGSRGPFHARDPGPRGHHVGGREPSEGEGAGQQGCGVPSRLPAVAERRTSERSSSAVRAEDSSSFGSIPSSRRTPFAVPFSSSTAGRKTAVKADLERHHELRGRQRQREREVLRHQLADDHREQGRDGHREHGADRLSRTRQARSRSDGPRSRLLRAGSIV